MFVERHSVPVTTAADGSATAYSPTVTGRILAVIYDKDDFADGVDFTITTDVTGQNVWVDTNVNASEQVRPRQAVHGTDGSAALYAAGGVAVLDHIYAANERIKFVIASGGDTKSGTFIVLVG